MTKSYLNYNEFDIDSAVNAGGATGSKKVKKGEEFYQLKSSIKDASFIRRLKAGSVDKENFGEVIAASVGRALTDSGKEGKVEVVPEVTLVLKEGEKQNKSKVMIASKYLSGVEGTIDDYAKKEGVSTAKRHVKVSAALDEKNKKDTWNISGDENKQLRQDLANGIAVSALSGDHDVNPGNMLVIKDLAKPEQKRIARIDFGHAFNDLISYKSFGGRPYSKNKILDFTNRETVNKFPSGDKAKLWRDYDGIIPSVEMVKAFTEMANSTKTQEGINNAKQQFLSVVKDLKNSTPSQDKTLEHIKKSLVAIHNNVADAKINSKKVTIEEAIEQTFKGIEGFYVKNQQQMKDVAKLMDMQIKIDQIINDKKDGKTVDGNIIKEIKDIYQEIENNPDNLIRKGAGKGIDWVKNSQNKKAFKGNLDSFIAQRGKDMGLSVEENKLLRQEDFKLPKKRNILVKAKDRVKTILNTSEIRNESSVAVKKIPDSPPIPQKNVIDSKLAQGASEIGKPLPIESFGSHAARRKKSKIVIGSSRGRS
ncbi:MAG: hypothetical protein EKK61_05420 [Rickettsiales bacterium]|nr:MAG: hypothetical protein EKK61_05420 [Rickettsiales bacterium]